LWGSHGLKVMKGDFTAQTPPRTRFNLVLTNPPYVRHHHLDGDEKLRLKVRVAESMKMEISGLAGLYCYFLLLAHGWMEDDGVAVWLIPSEFMDVNYGKTVKEYLTERVTLLQIHRYCPTDVQFADALVSSAVVIFRKTPPAPDHLVEFSFGGPIENPERDAMVPLATVKTAHKWTQFPENVVVAHRTGLHLGDLFAIKRGLATGSNDFFILTDEQVRERRIPRKFLKPILPGPRNLKTDVVEARGDGDPDLLPRLYLIDCIEPEDRIREEWPAFHDYLLHGKTKSIDISYLARHRACWYSQENRPPAPFLCTYMGRSRNGHLPFRFIWNRSQATAHNVYLLLYPKGSLRDALNHNPALGQRVFQALQRITPEQLVAGGRVYGGGLHKIEPKELAKISAQPILDAIRNDVQIAEQPRLF